MKKIPKLYLSTFVGLLAYCLAYMLCAVFSMKFIGYDKMVENQVAVRLSFALISAAIAIFIVIFVFKLIGRKASQQ